MKFNFQPYGNVNTDEITVGTVLMKDRNMIKSKGKHHGIKL